MKQCSQEFGTPHIVIETGGRISSTSRFNPAPILAVTLAYRQRIAGLLRDWREPVSRDYLVRLFAASAVTGYELASTLCDGAAASAEPWGEFAAAFAWYRIALGLGLLVLI